MLHVLKEYFYLILKHNLCFNIIALFLTKKLLKKIYRKVFTKCQKYISLDFNFLFTHFFIDAKNLPECERPIHVIPKLLRSRLKLPSLVQTRALRDGHAVAILVQRLSRWTVATLDAPPAARLVQRNVGARVRAEVAARLERLAGRTLDTWTEHNTFAKLLRSAAQKAF